ncbi:MAG: hypothetical protein FWG92_02400 [Leptospirales bacterium]|nr:hypothetical protein [Leptospirales bacterium]
MFNQIFNGVNAHNLLRSEAPYSGGFGRLNEYLNRVQDLDMPTTFRAAENAMMQQDDDFFKLLKQKDGMESLLLKILGGKQWPL